jgi:ferredoxin-NADP reductase
LLALTAQIVGSLLLVAMLLQVLVWLGSSLRRTLAERERDRLALGILEHRLETARVRRRELEQEQLSWRGFRKFKVLAKVREAEGILSFHLGPHDGKPLPPFRVGQYLTLQLKLPAEPRATVRCFSLSDCPRADHYRISVKQVPAPAGVPEARPGLASNYLHEHVGEADILDVKAPSGSFCLDLHERRPVVMIAGGVGVTPLLAMLNAVVESGAPRELWFFYGAGHRSELMQSERLEALALEHSWLRLHLCLSEPREGEIRDPERDHACRVSLELLRELLPSNNYEFFVCGPAGMMEAMTEGLRGWGVPREDVHVEAFGAATVRAARSSEVASEAFRVSFNRSGREARWDPAFGSLLELAEAQGVLIECGCRAGNCGTCLTAIRSGGVRHVVEPGAEIEPGTCLTCVAVPQTDLELDA